MTPPRSPPASASTNSAERAAILARIGRPLPRSHGYRLLGEGEAWFLLADMLVRRGELEAALAAFEVSRELDPARTDTLYGLVFVLGSLLRHKEALDVLQFLPETPQNLTARSNLELECGAGEQALASTDRALGMAPGHFDAQLNRGAALRMLGRLPDALVNDLAMARQHPDNPLASYNLGDALLANGRYDEALSALDTCRRLDPRLLQARMARALALTMVQRFDEADHEFAACREADPAATRIYLKNAEKTFGQEPNDNDPADPEARALFINRALFAQTYCDWANRAAVTELLPAMVTDPGTVSRLGPAIAFNSLLLELPFPLRQTISRGMALSAAALAATGRVYRRPRGSARPAAPKLRLGFLSPDFRRHPVGDSHLRQFELHDRTRFEVFAYSLKHDEHCEARQRIAQACDRYIDVSELPSEAIAQRIASDGIDILVDLSGYTDLTRPDVVAARPAPIQVQHMGTPTTSGATYIDYRITDRIVNPPDSGEIWDESLVWLPQTFWLVQDTLRAGPALPRSRYGLPDTGFVFCCFNTHQKIEPEVFDIWMRLLKAIDGSVLWLLSGSTLSRANLVREAEARGVSSARLRFAEFVPIEEHIARHACADLFLDTFIYNAHVTGLNALLAGLPVLTWLGLSMAGRMGASALHAAGLDDMIVHSKTAYEERALQLAREPRVLAEVRERLRAARDTAPLFRTEERVRQIERSYERMWSRYQAGLPPCSFEIDL